MPLLANSVKQENSDLPIRIVGRFPPIIQQARPKIGFLLKFVVLRCKDWSNLVRAGLQLIKLPRLDQSGYDAQIFPEAAPDGTCFAKSFRRNGFLIQWMDAETWDFGKVGLVEGDEGEVVVNGRCRNNRVWHT
jgi:hypothetical protein